MEQQTSRRPLVVGIGSHHGLDAVGWHVAGWLADESLLGFDVKQSRVPSDLLDWLDGRPCLALLDAFQRVESAELGPLSTLAPVGIKSCDVFFSSESARAATSCQSPMEVAGTRLEGGPRIVRLRWPDPRIIESLSATVHDLNLAQVLRLAERLGWLPPRVELWAIDVGMTAAERLDESTVAQIGRRIAAELQALLDAEVGVETTDSRRDSIAGTDQSPDQLKAGQGDA